MKKMVMMAAVAMTFGFMVSACGNKAQAPAEEAPATEEITAQAAEGELPPCCAEAQADSTKTCCCGGAKAEEAPAEGAGCCQGEKK